MRGGDSDSKTTKKLEKLAVPTAASHLIRESKRIDVTKSSL